MLRENPPAVPGHGAAVCCVVRGVTDALRQHAVAQAQSGRRVHVLSCEPVTKPQAVELSAHGVDAICAAQIVPPRVTIGGPNQPRFLQQSELAYQALLFLHRQTPFALIEFSCDAALGFRAVQAQRAGCAFGDTCLRVTGAAAEARRQREHRLPQPEDLAEEYCARYALRHAGNDAAPPRCGTPAAEPLVTICVPHFNMGQYLDDALASLAAQTYPALEVLIIDDGSTDVRARAAFERARGRHPRFTFLTQANAGIGATRNRGLHLAHGAYFLPMDADNIAAPDMVRRLVAGLERNPDLAALSCYFLAFDKMADIAAERFLYAYRPIGGPRVLGCLQNVYGDGNALFRTDCLRAVGGFGVERDASFEDWEAFVKLVNAGHAIDVSPDVLFYYRHRPAGFSRVTSDFANQRRILRRCFEAELSRSEREDLWSLLAGLYRRVESLEDENRSLRARLGSLRHRVADKVHAAVARVPALKRGLKQFLGDSVR